jgi:hypothetical protein
MGAAGMNNSLLLRCHISQFCLMAFSYCLIDPYFSFPLTPTMR